VLYSILWNWDAVAHAATSFSVPWRTVVPEPTLAAAFDHFAEIYRRINVRTIDGEENHQHCLFECPLMRMRAQLGLNANALV
jgi:hypothetical protein